LSQENVEIARQAIDAWDRHDRAAWLALHDQDHEVVPMRHFPEADVVRGREAAWEFFANISDQFEQFPIGNAEIVDAGADKVLIHYRLEVRGRASGAGAQAGYWDVVTFREGRIVREQWFLDRSGALEAAGLEE
jgi:ketosteroid isomerase-like protein